MDFLLFIVVAVLLWILYQLLISEEIRNSCSDKILTDSFKSLIEDGGRKKEKEEEKLESFPEKENKSKESEEASKEVGPVDFLAYDECISDNSSDIRYAEVVSKDLGESIDHHDGIITTTADDEQSAVQIKDKETSDEEVSKTDADLQSIISKGITEIASIPLVIAVTEAITVINENNEIKKIEVRDTNKVNATNVLLKDTKVEVSSDDSTEIEAFAVDVETDCIGVSNITEDKVENCVNENNVDTPAIDIADITSETEVATNYVSADGVIMTTSVDEFIKHTTVEEVLCSVDSRSKVTPVPDISVDVEVDIDVKEVKVFLATDKREPTPNNVVSLTFSKNGTEIPHLIINSEEVVDPLSAVISANEESKNSEFNTDIKAELTDHIEDNKVITEVQEMKSTITDTEKHETISAYRVSEPNCAKDEEYEDETDKLQDQQMHAFVDNIQNLTNEIHISEIKQVEYIQRKLEFTEISDEEEILYRNVTKRGDEESTEEVQTKNEISSTIVTNENISFDQQIGSSTTITKIINMSYTSEECTTESIELKTFDTNFLDSREGHHNGEQFILKSIQEHDNEDKNLIEGMADNLSPLCIIELDNSSEKVSDDNENMSLCPVKESDKTISLKKKPACGVLLFGGDELLSKIKTRRVIVDEYENKETQSLENNDNWRLSTKNKEVTEYKEQVTSNTTTTTTSQTTKASQNTHMTQETKKQTMFLNTSKIPDAAFGLSELLNSRTDDSKRISSSEGTLDISTMTSHNETNLTELITDIPEFETEALIHLNKDRVKGPVRRRRTEKAKE